MEKKKYFTCMPKGNNSYAVVEKELYGASTNAFLSKEEAINHFEKAEKKACKKYEKIMNGMHSLKKSVGEFSYGCDATSWDDSGLETQLYIEFNMDGYDFKFNQ